MEQIKEYEYIDLGLPSGLKWAKCNVGADKETDYGYYFQWGETEPHDADTPYNWVNYKYCKGSSTTLTKYNIMGEYGTVDNKLTLDLEDDAARANMGGDWRMPTQADFIEMLDYTDSEWVENFNGSGVNGRKFISKINGNSIFIPASGGRLDSAFRHQGSYGLVWCSSLDTFFPIDAWELYFDSDSIRTGYSFDRFFGFAVRGVL